MAIAIALVLIVVFSLAFNFLSPWWFLPLASNWASMDNTIIMTLVIAGVVFTAVTIFTAYAVVKYRYRPDRRAAYEPENKKLEYWLMGITSAGIVAMLTPGLTVWHDYLDVPKDAMVVEAVGQQWQWSFRLPGKDNILGLVDTRLINADNPFGLHDGNEFGQDDVLIDGNELHLPLGKPVKVLLRSKDVLHDFYVPQFRAKMDMVPGQVSRLWFTPTKAGKYEIACAEYCGIGHFAMRGFVVVDEPEAYQTWLTSQQTFAQKKEAKAGATMDPVAAKGQKLAADRGCLGCHSVDGAAGMGPTWKGLYGKTEKLSDGSNVVADDNYLKESILNPNAKVVDGFAPAMPPYDMNAEEVAAIIAYTKYLSGAGTSASATPNGQQIAQDKGCLACHTVDGTSAMGPTWKDLYGKTEKMSDGSSVVADEAYLKESITNPGAKVVDGFSPTMPPNDLTPAEQDAVVGYMKDLSATAGAPKSDVPKGAPKSEIPPSAPKVEPAAKAEAPKPEQAATGGMNGRQIAEAKGCLSCHSTDGSANAGPTWKGLYGKTETLADGRTVNVDDAYLKESVRNANAAIVKGAAAVMPSYNLSDAELDALVAYTKELSK